MMNRCANADGAKLKEDCDSSLVQYSYSKGQTYNAMQSHLEKIDWLLFITLTWRPTTWIPRYYKRPDGTLQVSDKHSRMNDTDYAESLRQGDFKWFIEGVCGKLKLRSRKLAYYVKPEFNGGGGHYHMLLARHGTNGIPRAVIEQTMQEIWTNNFGVADVQPFNTFWQREGTAYQSKYEFDRDGNIRDPKEFKSKALDRIILGTVNEVSKKDALQPVESVESVSFCETL